VLNYDYRETLTNREVKPSDPLLRLGDVSGVWEVEMKIPQKHIGQVLSGLNVLDRPKKLKLLELRNQALEKGPVPEEQRTEKALDALDLAELLREAADKGWLGRLTPADRDLVRKESELDVDLLLKSDPTHTYTGKLKRSKIAGEANPNRDDQNESE